MPAPSFIDTQSAALDRYGVDAEDRFVAVPMIEGRAHVLVAGEGPPVVILNGIGTPAAMFAPLMAELDGVTMYAVDLPGFGLTDTTATLTDDFRATAVQFLEQVLDALGLDRPAFVTNSLGSQWAIWLAIDRPDRVAALVHVGWPAVMLDTSAPLPMRLLSVRWLGRLMMKIQPPSQRQVEQLSKLVKEHPLPPEIADLLLATERLPGFEPTFLATLHTLVRLRGARPDMALNADQLTCVHQPSLLILAADDPMGSESDSERLAAAVPETDIHIVDGGHVPWIHHTDQIAPLVNAFLTDINSRTGQ
jgi:2-hydroxy-6-oxonona-2,4-dienedioate hydrolase